MTRDQIIQWAREATKHANEVAGFPERTDHAVTEWTTAFNTRFAQLARADERERCAQEIEKYDDEAWFLLQQDDCAAAIRSRKD